jgi:hypothetical protein
MQENCNIVQSRGIAATLSGERARGGAELTLTVPESATLTLAAVP